MADRVVLITGAGNGIGAALAVRLAELGDSVALLDVDPDAAARVAERCGERALAIRADITDLASLQSAAAATVDRFGRIDVCVANAGIGVAGSLRHLDPDAFDAQFRVNVGGTFRTVRACLPELEKSKGYLVLIASLSSIAAPPGLGAYGASKAATESLGDVLRIELAHLGIAVGVAYFTWIATDLVEGAEREQRAFKVMRDNMAWPAKRVIAVDDAIEALVRGIAKRSRRIIAPGFIRGLLRVRGFARPLVERTLLKMAPAVDAATVEDIAEKGLGAAIRSDTAGGEAAARSVGRDL
jgi:NAD(P)-dependent dehydrogenase (short-subunit alcohol dehydrogenase family)